MHLQSTLCAEEDLVVESWDLCIAGWLCDLLLGRNMLEFAPHCIKKVLLMPCLLVLYSAPLQIPKHRGSPVLSCIRFMVPHTWVSGNCQFGAARPLPLLHW